MQIVLTQEVAEELRKKYVVLELDTIDVLGHGLVPAYCVLSAEDVVMEMASLGDNVYMHEQLVEAIKADEIDKAVTLITQLKGRFRGTMDSFYEIVLQRIADNGSARLVQNATI